MSYTLNVARSFLLYPFPVLLFPVLFQCGGFIAIYLFFLFRILEALHHSSLHSIRVEYILKMHQDQHLVLIDISPKPKPLCLLYSWCQGSSASSCHCQTPCPQAEGSLRTSPRASPCFELCGTVYSAHIFLPRISNIWRAMYGVGKTKFHQCLS